MRCLIAAEGEVVERIAAELQRSGLYPGWEFSTCSNSRELENWSSEDIDVLVLSRTLPGEDTISLLKRLRTMFMTAHIVLLVGKACEQQRTYIKVAMKNGMNNIVTGSLPGDRPYNIFIALKTPKEPDKDGYYEINNEVIKEEDLEDNEPVAQPVENMPYVDEKIYPNEDTSKPTGQTMKSVLNEIVESGVVENGANTEILKSKLQEIIEMLETETNSGQGSESHLTQRDSMHSGISVFSSANKGGVGKTTVAATVAVALAKAGVPTVLIDLDLGSPNVTSFLGLKDVPGMEVLAGKAVKPNILRDVISQCNGLDVLPGPQNKTMPNFRPGQLLEIIKVLKQMYPVVIADTPPEYWTKPWLAELFSIADYVLAVVDQSILSEHDTQSYAPYLLSMGVTPEKIGIVLNRFSPKLHNPKTVERNFCSGFKKEVQTKPKIVAVIPEDWNTYVLKGYKGEVSGIIDVQSQWSQLAKRIAEMAGYSYSNPKKKEKSRKGKSSLGSLFGGLLKR